MAYFWNVFIVARYADDGTIQENARVCSTHFCKEDFVGVEGYTQTEVGCCSFAVTTPKCSLTDVDTETIICMQHAYKICL